MEDIKEIVRNWLRENNYDGLLNIVDDCCCDQEDLMDCYNGRIPHCMPGVKRPCDCNEERHDCHIAPKGMKEY